jgi:hypothetical protein
MKPLLKTWLRYLGKSALVLAFVAGGAVMMMWLAGKFSPKVPEHVVGRDAALPDDSARTVTVHRIRVPTIESAVGTIRAVHETTIGSKLLARRFTSTTPISRPGSSRPGPRWPRPKRRTPRRCATKCAIRDC